MLNSTPIGGRRVILTQRHPNRRSGWLIRSALLFGNGLCGRMPAEVGRVCRQPVPAVCLRYGAVQRSVIGIECKFPEMKDESDCQASTGSFAIGRVKLFLFFTAFVGISVLVSYTLYTQFQGQVSVSLTELISWPLLLSLLVLLLIYFCSDGLRLLFTLRALGYRIAPSELVPLVFINLFVSNVTPMATGGGVAQIWYLRRHNVPIGAATAATTLRTLLAVVFIFIPTPMILLGMGALRQTPLLNHFSVYLAGFACIYIAVFAVVLLRMRWIAATLFAFIRLLCELRLVSRQRVRYVRFRVMREMVHFASAFGRFFKGSPVDVGAAVLFTGVFLLSLFSFPSLILWGVGHPVDYMTSLGLLTVTTFIMYFSPTPGAAGVAEGLFVLFFQSIVAAEYLLLGMVAWRFFTIYLGVLIGMPVTWKALFEKRPRCA